MSEDRRRRGGRGITLRGVLIGMLCACVVIGGVLWAWNRSAGGRPSQTRWESKEKARKALEGKTPEEAIKIAGRPDLATGDAWSKREGEDARWDYFGVVWNKATGRHDGTLVVYFAGGRAVRVEQP